MANSVLLASEPNPYAFWTEKTDPATGLTVPGYGANTIFRFPRPILLKRVEIDAFRVGQDVLRPKSVMITALTGQDMSGEGVFAGLPDWCGDQAVIEFTETVYAWAVSIRCDAKDAARFHSIMMWDPAEWNVPFRFFASARFYGIYVDMPDLLIPVRPPLHAGMIAPQSFPTVKAWADGMFIHFESRYLKTSFSLKRPFISHLSWDALGERALTRNFLADYLPCHSSGPWTLDLVDATPPFHWGGRVEAVGNQVTYRDLHCRDGLTLDAQFEVREKEIIVRLTQRCAQPTTLLEAAAWRFVWDVHAAGSISTLARPIRGTHRNGYTEPKGSWHVSNEGSLAFEVVAGADPVLLHTEQTGFHGKAPTWNYAGFGRRYIFSQLQLGARPEPFGPVTLLPGEYQAEVRLTAANVEPNTKRPADVHRGIRRAWGSGFFFRPEQSGLANNSCSVLAANCLYGSADLAVYAAHNPPIPPAIELLRYTLDLVIKKGGPHYGILEGATAQEALRRLEAQRKAIGHTDFRYGLMTQLMPVPAGDLTSSAQNSLLNRGWRNGLRPDGLDTFGVFCNGCLTPTFVGFYLGALSRYGFIATADQICDQLLDSFAQGLFDGDRNGAEFFTHEGIPCGYEGSLIHCYYVLAEIAKHKGWVEPIEPEWWPAVYHP